MMKFLQKLGKALMLPVACLPICGILMGLGYALCPSTMQGGDVVGIVQQIGFYLVKAGGALIDNMAILFAIGIGVGMSEDNDGTGGLAALASWLMLTTLLSVGAVSVIKTLEEGTTAYIAFSKIANPFIGIIAGVIGSSCYNKFKGTKLNVSKLPVQKKSFVDNVISVEEYNKLLKCLKADNKMKGYWMVRFLGQTGARVSEFVRFEKKTLEDGYIDLDTKCHSRRIWVPDRLISESKEYFEGVQGRWLFPGQKKGQHMTTRSVDSRLKDFAEKYQIRKEVMHPHAFRHFFAIQSLNNGVDMSLLKDLLGHGSIDTTQIYTQLSQAEQKKRFNEAVKW